MPTTIDGYTQAEAATELARWKAAVAAIASAQSYTIGLRILTRINLGEARKQVGYFAGLVARFASGMTSGGVRAIRVVPRDT